MSTSNRRQFLQSTTAAAATPSLSSLAQAPPARSLLSGAWPAAKLSQALLPRERWQPFPSITDRAAWEKVPADARRAVLVAGERGLAGAWPVLPATLFLEYARIGNRSNYEGVRSGRRNRLRELVVAECFEAQGRFLDEIANGIWLTCEETYWGVPAHVGVQKAGSGLPDAAEPTVDLFAADTGSLLAWTEYLLGARLDKVSPLVRPRIRLEINRRILTPCFDRVDFWWMGLDPRGARSMNNWNPWINSNWLTCVLLMESDPARRNATVHKILRSLDRFLDSYHDDGGCDEGPGYWNHAGGSLFECLELLRSASGGAIDFYSQPLVREIGRYIYRAHIGGDYFVNFADASARVAIQAGLVFRYGRRIGDAKMQALGAYAAAQQAKGAGGAHTGTGSIARQLDALFDLDVIRAAPAAAPHVRDAWLPGTQIFVARAEEGSSRGLYLAAQGGHNAESHNHNDVGNFIVYADGRPAIIDAGVETYTAKTFSSRRYEIWTMQSAYHNLPTVNGVMQGAGRQFAARNPGCRADDAAAEFRLDIAGAYPPEAGIETWVRTLRLDRRNNQVEITEDFRLNKPADRIELTLMTPADVSTAAPGELVLTGGLLGPIRVKVIYDANVLAPKVETIPVADARLAAVWGKRLHRVLLAALKPARQGNWSVRVMQG